MPVSTPSPPHDLELVIDFVNTLDLEEQTDALSAPEELGRWLTERGLLEAGAVADQADLAEAIELRECMRSALLAHNGTPDPDGVHQLEHAAERGRLSVRFDPDGNVRLAPRADGVAGALARLLVPIAEGAADGSWQRVKACAAGDCLWAFYDRSRNRSGRWCDMAVCGNRTKVRAYRTKQRD